VNIKKLRFGGHETFAIREGWLHKGLTLLAEDSESYFDPYVEDLLGVGRNMAKSIWFWLRSTGLIEKSPGKNQPPPLTELGEAVHKYDPYFVDSGTWWVLHANLCGLEASLVVWHWFFNHFSGIRFDKPMSIDQCRRFLEVESIRLPSATTLNRDMTCLLQSYASPVPRSNEDPEEGNDCPFQDLGLVLNFRDSGFFEFVRSHRSIPAPVFGYVVAKTFGVSAYQDEGGQKEIRVSLQELSYAPGSPGRIFGLNQNSLMDTLVTIERHQWLSILSLAGHRQIEMANYSPLKWLTLHYKERSYRSVA